MPRIYRKFKLVTLESDTKYACSCGYLSKSETGLRLHNKYSHNKLKTDKTNVLKCYWCDKGYNGDNTGEDFANNHDLKTHMIKNHPFQH